MMAKRITKSGIPEFVKALARKFTVVGPVKKQDQYVFSELGEDERLELE